MVRLWLLLVVTTGCRQLFGIETATAADAGPTDDGAIDSPSAFCYGSSFARLCFDGAPAQDVALSGTLDTSNDATCSQIVTAAMGGSLCVIAGAHVTVPSTVIAIGSRPLVVVAADTIDINGTLDASSTIDPRRRGAGGNDPACSVSTNGGNDRGGGAGGGGGSFGSTGSNGGSGDRNNNAPPAGSSPGGMAGAVQTATSIRGGCSGGRGGEGDDSTGTDPGGPAGDGGGAVYLIAGSSITISGDVFASGAGGGADPGNVALCATGNGGFEQGGGGGGSGGLIGLDAPAIAISGRIAANGGGGGGGGGCHGGAAGGDGSTTKWNLAATGGTGDTVNAATNGANGSAIAMPPPNAQDADSGAGGGGGGLGVVLTFGAVQGGAMISPAPAAP